MSALSSWQGVLAIFIVLIALVCLVLRIVYFVAELGDRQEQGWKDGEGAE